MPLSARDRDHVIGLAKHDLGKGGNGRGGAKVGGEAAAALGVDAAGKERAVCHDGRDAVSHGDLRGREVVPGRGVDEGGRGGGSCGGALSGRAESVGAPRVDLAGEGEGERGAAAGRDGGDARGKVHDLGGGKRGGGRVQAELVARVEAERRHVAVANNKRAIGSEGDAGGGRGRGKDGRCQDVAAARDAALSAGVVAPEVSGARVQDHAAVAQPGGVGCDRGAGGKGAGGERENGGLVGGRAVAQLAVGVVADHTERVGGDAAVGSAEQLVVAETALAEHLGEDLAVVEGDEGGDSGIGGGVDAKLAICIISPSINVTCGI